MRYSGGIMLRSVARCLSQHRPSPSPPPPPPLSLSPVLSQSCVITTCNASSSSGLLPLSRPHYIVPRHSRSSPGWDPSSSRGGGGGVGDFQGTTTTIPLPVQQQSSIRQQSSSSSQQKETILSTFLHHQHQQRRRLLSVGDGDEESDLSRHHEESLVIGYSPEQLYAVVAAVDMYEDFVPWCQSSKVLSQEGDHSIDAELEIGFKFFVERYISHVELKKPNRIKTSVSQSTLFDYLINVWEFKPGPTPHSTNLHFLVEFQFRSPLYRKVANMFFNEVAQRLVGSFENRCRTVYGPSVQVKARNHQVHAKSTE